MRVTSNLFPEQLKDQLNYIQTKQLKYQTQSATGLKLTQSSDNPGDFSIAQTATEDLSQILGFTKASDEAKAILERNHYAMTQLHSLTARAYELGQRGNNFFNASDLRTMAVEMEELIKQITDTANTKVDGFFIFGGTENAQPVTGATTATFALNPAATTNVTNVEINQNYTFDTGIVAGNGAANTGFLWDGSTNIITAVRNAFNQLNSGQAITSTQNDDLRRSLELISSQVGKTASKLAALETNASRLQVNEQNHKERVATLTQANMAETLTELQKTQFNYQAALQSGARILNISLLDYVR